MPSVPLYRQVLGDDFDRLPPAVRRLHDHDGAISATGSCEVMRGRSWFARLIGRLFSLPPAGRNVPVRVSFSALQGEEVWRRDFGGHRLTSRQGLLAGRAGLLYERFGAGCFAIEPRVLPEGLDLQLRGASLLGMALPRFLWPQIIGRERMDSQGRFTFFVSVRLPVIGLLFRYEGYLLPEAL